MAEETAIDNHAANLRRQAEEQLLAQEEAELAELSPEATRRLLHELHVHQIELELQNEELRRAYQELDTVKARYFDLYELAPVGYCTLNDQGFILEANLTAAALLNVERSALVKRPISRFILTADQDIYYRHRQALFETEQPQGYELRLLRRGSPPFWARLEATVAQDDEGALVCRLVLSDITARKQAEKALQESEARYRLLADNMADVVWMLDLTSQRITYVSPSVETLRGYTVAEVLTQPLDQVITPAALAMVHEHLPGRIAAFLAGDPQAITMTHEVEQLCKDGSTVWTEVVTTLLRGEAGLQVVGVSRNIAARKRAEQARQESLAKLEQLFQILPVGLSVLDHNHSIVKQNPALEHILGISQAGLAGGEYRQRRYIRPDGSPMPATEFASSRVRQGESNVSNVETGVVKEDGTVVWTSVSAVTVPLEDWSTVIVTQDITAKKQAEQALQSSQQNLSALIENTDASIWSVDGQYRMIVGNGLYHRNIRAVIGRSPAPGENVLSFPLPPAALDEWRGYYDRALAGETFSTEANTHFEEETHTVEYRFNPIKDAAGQITGVTVLGRDITARKQMEEALQESERKFRTIVETAGEGIVVAEPGGKYTFVNQQMADMLGYTVDEILGKFSVDFTFKEQSPHLLQVRTDLYEGNTLEGELKWRRRDGSPLWTLFHITPMYDDRGNLVANFGMHTNITTRKQAEAARERYAARVQTLHDIERAILAAQSPGEISTAAVTRLRQQILCRYASISLFDFDRMEKIVFACASDADSFIRPNERLPITSAWIAQLRQGLVITIQDVAAVPDPPPPMQELLAEGIHSSINVPLQARGALIGMLSLAFNQPGTFSPEDVEIAAEVAASVALALDQARLLEAERTAHERLQQLTQQLVIAQEEERRHLSRELHDEVGQVMLAIKTNLEALRLTSERANFNTTRLSDSIRIAGNALEQIRALALNLRPPLLDDFGLRPTLEWYLERQAGDAPFKINFQSDLPDIRFSTAVETNCFRVVQAAITNIARHAQATQVEVRLLWHLEQRVLELSVSDNGRGFDVAAALDQARHGQSLGLLGMQERIQLIGGEMVIESTPGQGTHIRAWVPVEIEDEAREMTPLRVLLADDHALMRAGLRTLLEQLGVQVVGEAGDGREVLHLLPSLNPDLVLMDIAMPGLNGLEVTARITQANPKIRVVILSMYATAEYARRAIQAGAAGYLLKDANAAELDLALQAVKQGETYLSPRIAQFVVADYAGSLSSSKTALDKLSPRQRETLQLIAEGLSRRDIAATLGISVKTFDTYRAQLMEQLNLHDVAALVRFATSSGLIPDNE